MSQVGDGSVVLEGGEVTGDVESSLSEEWVKEFESNNKPEDLLDDEWVKEYKERVMENSTIKDFFFQTWGSMKEFGFWKRFSGTSYNLTT